eukprot:scaffold103152_cov30-Tisochrysis_lutea.AAC.2
MVAHGAFSAGGQMRIICPPPAPAGGSLRRGRSAAALSYAAAADSMGAPSGMSTSNHAADALAESNSDGAPFVVGAARTTTAVPPDLGAADGDTSRRPGSS